MKDAMGCQSRLVRRLVSPFDRLSGISSARLGPNCVLYPPGRCAWPFHLRPGRHPMDSSHGHTTRVRFVVMGYLCALAYILYIDRICIGQAGTVMKAELGLTNFQWGLVGVAFQIAYAIFEPTTGHWGDRHGSRAVLIRIVLWWSVFTALTGCVWNFSYELLPGVVLNGFVVL